MLAFEQGSLLPVVRQLQAELAAQGGAQQELQHPAPQLALGPQSLVGRQGSTAMRNRGKLIMAKDIPVPLAYVPELETEARLAAEARVRGLPLESLAEQLLSEALSGRSPAQRRMSVDEFHQMLADIAQASESLPELPTESFSRESFYEDGQH